MSETTNLKLFKHDNPSTNNNQFNVENALNKNWDKIDEFAGETKEQLDSLQQDKEVLENKVETLETDNETNKLDIVELQQESSDLEDYISNILPSGQTSGEDITINDSAKYPCVIEVEGNSWQETRTGKNKFDYKNANIKANSYINVNTGEITSTSNTNYATENYIEIEQQNYSIPAATSNFRLAFYSAEKVFISSKNSNFINFEVPEDAKYIRFSDTNLSNIMLLEGNTEDTEYEEYGASPSTKYPSNLEAVGDSGSLKITVENQDKTEEQNAIFPFAEGQRLLKNCKLGDAEIIQNRKRIICNGTESWTANATSSSTGGKFRWRLEVADIKQVDANTLADIQCTHYKAVKAGTDGTYQGVEGIASQNTNITIFDPNYATSSATEWKAYVAQQYSAGTPIEIEYELAEPETVTYTEAQKTAKAEIDKLKTYKGVTHITTDSKAILDVSYKKDLETLINNLSSEVTN